MSGVSYYQLEQNTVDIPTTAGASTYTRGFYGVNGTMEHLMLHLELTTAGGALTTDLSALFSQFRLIINGDVIYDWTQGVAPASDSNIPGRFGYFINSIGGRAYTVPTDAGGADLEAWIAIPVGAVLNDPTPRFEITLSYNDYNLIGGAGATITTGSLQYWARFNSASQTTTRVLSATSFQHAANAIEQVVARVPQMQGGFTCLGVFVQNDDEADNMGAQGIRSLALSQFGMDLSMHRWANGELGNGIMFTNPALDATAQTYATSRAGALFLPLYGLAAGDITLLVDNGANATTRLYTPVMTAPIRGTAEARPRQTVKSPGNAQKAVLQRTDAGL